MPYLATASSALFRFAAFDYPFGISWLFLTLLVSIWSKPMALCMHPTNNAKYCFIGRHLSWFQIRSVHQNAC